MRFCNLTSEAIFTAKMLLPCLPLSSHWREVTVKVTGLRFLTCPQNSKQAAWHVSALLCSTEARNPREITILLAFVCREPWCIEKHNFPLFFQLYCTSICIQRGTLGLSPTAIHSANEVFMTQAFAFWYVTANLFNSSHTVMSEFKIF